MAFFFSHQDLVDAYEVWDSIPYLAEGVNDKAPGAVTWNNVRLVRKNVACFMAMHVLGNLSRSVLYGICLGAVARMARGGPGLGMGIVLVDAVAFGATVLTNRALDKYAARVEWAIEQIENAAAERGVDIYEKLDDNER